MARGVKKIKYVKGKIFTKLSIPDQLITMPPDTPVIFDVKEWLPDTTKEDKLKDVLWLKQDHERQAILKKSPINFSKFNYKLQLTRKECGPVSFFLEASLSGNRDGHDRSGLYIRGKCDQKIISSKWCTDNDGVDK